MSQTLDLKGIKTLVVDDDFNVRDVLKRTLAQMGAEVVEVENGPRGIVELKHAREQNQPFRLIFIDTTMSPMDGFEMAGHLKAHPAELAGAILMLDGLRAFRDVGRAREAGVGATILKPLTRPDLIEAVSNLLGLSSGAVEATGQARRPRILIAEDQPEIRNILRVHLGDLGYEVDVAQDGGVALDMFRMAAYDLIFMDIQMPGFDGYWATREIRAWERKSQLKRTPIIAITAHQYVEDAQKSFRAGLDGYLVKPVTKETLLKVARKHLGGTAGAPSKSATSPSR